MQWHRWFPGDYLRDTGDLSLSEHGAYRVLLDHYYSTDGRLKADMVALYRICRAMTDEEQSAVGRVVKMFFSVDAEGWLRNKKADAEIKAGAEYHAKAVERARNAAKHRWGNATSNATSIPSSNAQAVHRECLGDAIPQPQEALKEGDSVPATIFGSGLQVLVSAGTPEKDARTFLGMCLSKWADTDVRDALLAASGKADPLAYARKVLSSRPEKPKPPKGSDAVLAKLRQKFPSVRLASDGKAFFDPITQNRFSLAGERVSGA